MPKKEAVRLWHKARQFDRQTRQAGQRGGAIGPTALKVLETLIFDFLNFRTGQLDPAQGTIAERANLCVRAVRTALKRLREVGILAWVRRCSERRDGNRFVLAQDSNAYTVLSSSFWRGYAEPPPLPVPHPEAWGACPPLLSTVDQALVDRRQGGSMKDMVCTMGLDPHDALALARLGQAVVARES